MNIAYSWSKVISDSYPHNCIKLKAAQTMYMAYNCSKVQ